MGKRRGKRLLRFFGVAAREAGGGPNQAHASGYGFNLHAGVSVSARNRTKLERLIRYMARPALSNERLEKLHDGRISLRLKRPWHDGTSHLIFTPLEFMERLVSLIPPPRLHMIRYHGVFAPNSKWRKEVVPKSVAVVSDCHNNANDEGACHHGHSRRLLGFAKLMQRVFEIDVLQCPKCKGRMQRIAFITERSVIRKMLRASSLPADSPVIAPARIAYQTSFDY